MFDREKDNIALYLSKPGLLHNQSKVASGKILISKGSSTKSYSRTRRRAEWNKSDPVRIVLTSPTERQYYLRNCDESQTTFRVA